MNIREKQEQTELSLLSPYATRSIDTKGRRKPEEECETVSYTHLTLPTT